MTIREVSLTDSVIHTLIRLSEAWEAEQSCYGYRANTLEDLKGNRVFLAMDDEAGEILGYLFGHVYFSERMRSVMPDGTPCFEVEELYVVPPHRSEGIGTALVRYASDAVRSDAAYLTLSTASKNWRSVLHFYVDELDFAFWSARLFRPIA